MNRWVVLLLLLVPSAVSAQSAPARPAITGISHVVFFGDDVSKSQAFYGGLLGWQPVREAGSTGERFYANHLQYVELVAPPQVGQAIRLDRIAFSTADVEGLRRYLKANGIGVPAAVTFEADGNRSFLTHDLEGNSVEFTQAGNHPIAKPAKPSVSGHIMHAGYVVRDRALADHFYKDLLGFHLYWQGGAKPEDTDWVMMQVPTGTDWVEYMLYLPQQPSRRELAGANHIAPGVVSVAQLQKDLEQRGWTAPGTKDPKTLGLDGKWQLDLNDPDGTRVEFMEFAPVKTPCCSAYTGVQPVVSSAW